MNTQWLNVPTRGVPRTSDGNPNFPGCDAVSDQFINIAAGVNGGLPDQAWARDLVKARQSEQRVNDPMSHCIPVGPIRLQTWNGPTDLLDVCGDNEKDASRLSSK